MWNLKTDAIKPYWSTPVKTEIYNFVQMSQWATFIFQLCSCFWHYARSYLWWLIQLYIPCRPPWPSYLTHCQNVRVHVSGCRGTPAAATVWLREALQTDLCVCGRWAAPRSCYRTPTVITASNSCTPTLSSMPTRGQWLLLSCLPWERKNQDTSSQEAWPKKTWLTGTWRKLAKYH